jgi:hypothetical protein
MEKYGFIYIWYDKKHKKYYVGRHWGTEVDGYVCSSNNMRHNYRYRPHDFKRRIIKKIYDKDLLVEEEQRYLNMIKPEECKIKYYNVSLKSNVPTMRGKKHSKETKEKIRQSNTGKIHSEETKEKLRQINLGKKHSEETKQKMRDNHNRNYDCKIFKSKISQARKGKPLSEEHKKKLSLAKIGNKNRLGGKKYYEQSV